MLVIDDLGAEQSTPWAAEKLFQLFYHRYNQHLPTVITTNDLGLQTVDVPTSSVCRIQVWCDKSPLTRQKITGDIRFSSKRKASSGYVEAILDYVEGVYEADAIRIERSVHQDLSKRGFFVSKDKATESIMPFAAFIEHTKTYNKDSQFPPDAPKEIILYEVLDHTASAKLIAAWGIDYMHLAKYNNKWMIIHVLWQTLPENKE